MRLRGIKVQSAGGDRKFVPLNGVKNQVLKENLYLVLTVYSFSKTIKL